MPACEIATTNDLLGAALAYAQMKFAVFPCRPGRKEPRTTRGFHDATKDNEQIRRWWGNSPTANIGIATGNVSSLLVIDIDPRHGGNVETLQEKHGDLPYTAIVRTGSGGQHVYLQHPSGSLSCSNGKLGPGLDIKADGGYVIAPPSLHPDGERYCWDNEHDIADIPLAPCPNWLATLLSQDQEAVLREPARTKLDKTELLEVEKRAAAYLDALPPAISGQGGHNATYVAATALVHGFGLPRDRALRLLIEKYNPRCQPPWSTKQLQHKVDDAVNKPHERPYGWLRNPAENKNIDLSGITGKFAGTTAPDPEEASATSPVNPGPFPLSLIEQIPDIVQRVMDYYRRCAVEIQPVLMLGSLIAATGTVLGHKVRDISGLRTNVYTVGISESGSGKEATREIIRKVFQFADIEEMCGPEDFASDAGLIAIVETQNPILFQLDEFGRLMNTLNVGPAKNPHTYNIASVLLKFFGKANSVFRSKAYAEVKRNKIIHYPHVCLYGTSVRNGFWKALNCDSLEGGFLPRLLIFADYGDPQPGEAIESNPPTDVVEFFAGWVQRRNTKGNLEQAGTSVIHPSPMVVPYTPDAKAIMDGFRCTQKTEQRKLDELGVLWSRARENAGKLALIYACWKNSSEVVVDAEAAEWAVQVTSHVVCHTVYEANLCMSESPFHARCQKVMQKLEVAESRQMSRRELTRATRSMTPRERDEAIQSLMEQGRLSVQTEDTAGRPKVIYKAI